MVSFRIADLRRVKKIARNIRDNMEFLELPGGGRCQLSSVQSFSATQHSGWTQVDEVEGDLTFLDRDPRPTGHGSTRGTGGQ